MKKTDLAYIAGIIDGEGAIIASATQYRQRRAFHVRVSLEMCQDYLPRWLFFFFWWKILHKNKENQKQPHYVWKVSGLEAITFLKAIYRYLQLKKEHATIAFRLFGLKPYRKWTTPAVSVLQEAEAIALHRLQVRGYGKYNQANIS